MGTRAPNVDDRRVQRTRRLLHEAFISLILERGYNAVTIRDVVERAGVGRSTFYTHFADLEEVLVGWPAGHRWLREFAAGGREERRPLGFTRALLEHVDEHRRIWRALVGKRGGMVIKDRFRRDLLEVVREDVVALAGKQPAAVLDGIVHYVAGALMELVFWWLDARTALAPADVDAIFHRLTAPALEAIARPTASTSVPR
jgi:AcrR family transcriptional regulator